MLLKNRKQKTLAIIIAIAVIAIVALIANKKEVEIQIRNLAEMQVNYATAEVTTYDVSEAGDGSVTATLSEDGVLTISGVGAMKNWGGSTKVPWYSARKKITQVKIEEGVTSIGSYALYDCENLTEIEIPEGVTKIANRAIWYCENLAEIDISSSVTNIGAGVLSGCTSLTNINVNSNNTNYCDENGVLYTKDKTKILKYPAGKTETKYVIPNGVTSIEDEAFYYCANLVEIEIPSNVQRIGSAAFYFCYNVIEINIPNGVTSIEESTFYTCESLKSLDIPASVTTIGAHAFAYCRSLTKIKIPEQVTSIEERVFESCEELTNIEIPNTITSIGSYAFAWCDNLNNIYIPQEVTTIEERAFTGCISLTEIEIPQKVANIGDGAFANCRSLKNISVDNNNANYYDDNGVLYTKDKTQIIIYPAGKNETEYTILNGATSISKDTFYGCINLINIEIPDSVTSVGAYAFSNCESLVEIEIPDGITCIEYMTFYNCRNLTQIKIPDSVTAIDSFAFDYCKSLTKIEISSNVTSIGAYAFANCVSLTEVKIPSTVQTINSDVFRDSKISKLITTESNIVELPEILKRAQDKEDILYSNEGLRLTNCSIEDGQIKLNDGATYAEIYVKSGKLYKLTYIVSYNEWDISEAEDGSVTAILSENGVLTISGTGAMKNWYEIVTPWYNVREQIKQVKIGEGITNIGDYAFDGCVNLKKIDMPNSITSIGYDSFYECISLADINIPEKVSLIDEWAFAECTSLREITIPSSVTSIDGTVFDNCTNLTDISVSEENMNYCDENGVLYTKDKTKIIAYPAGKKEAEYKIANEVTTIGINAFSYSNLESIYIPKGVTNIERWAFYGCANLKNIFIPTSVTNIEEAVFYDCYILTIICYEGSAAETYAIDNEIPYEIISLTSTKVEIDHTNLIIKGINPETIIKELKAAIESNLEYQIIDLDGNVIEDETALVGTGYKLKLEGGLSYIIAVKGDLNGDGKIKLSDISIVNKYRLNKTTLEEIYLLAGDVTGDGEVSFRDMTKMNRYRLHKITEL